MDLETQALGIAALADPTRRALYDYVVAKGEPVGREQAAQDLGLAGHNVNFHLDRLVEEGLLEVEYRRLSGKTGPGAGRPSKLYRRAAREFSVSLPPRRYDLVGEILAAAITEAAQGGDLAAAVKHEAHDAGAKASLVEDPSPAGDSAERISEVLGRQGFEPDVDGHTMYLRNCPFDSLAHKHAELVCGLNVDYVQGVLDGIGCSGAKACLDPAPGRCCVSVELVNGEAGSVSG